MLLLGIGRPRTKASRKTRQEMSSKIYCMLYRPVRQYLTAKEDLCLGFAVRWDLCAWRSLSIKRILRKIIVHEDLNQTFIFPSIAALVVGQVVPGWRLC